MSVLKLLTPVHQWNYTMNFLICFVHTMKFTNAWVYSSLLENSSMTRKRSTFLFPSYLVCTLFGIVSWPHQSLVCTWLTKLWLLCQRVTIDSGTRLELIKSAYFHITSTFNTTLHSLLAFPISESFQIQIQIQIYFNSLHLRITRRNIYKSNRMSANVLASRDVNVAAPQMNSNKGDIKSMEYHRQVLQNKLEEEAYVFRSVLSSSITNFINRGDQKYVSPSDTIMSPCTAKLSAYKNKHFGKSVLPPSFIPILPYSRGLPSSDP